MISQPPQRPFIPVGKLKEALTRFGSEMKAQPPLTHSVISREKCHNPITITSTGSSRRDPLSPRQVDADTWQRVQDLLAENGRVSRQGRAVRSDALLAGLLRCRPCNCAMTPAKVVKRGGRRYAYYVCTGAQKRGWHTCPSKSIPAATLERFVLQQLVGLDDAPRMSPAGGESTGGGPNAAVPATLDPDRLSAAERIHLIRSRVERVEYDGGAGKIAITVRSHDEATREESVALASEEEVTQ